MLILGAKWTPTVNLLLIGCGCGRTVEHRADRWTVRCCCGSTAHLRALREEYVRRHVLSRGSVASPHGQ